jgi:hypothetical protein
MSWYSYKILYIICIKLNELKANILTIFFYIQVFTALRRFRTSISARVCSEDHFAEEEEVEGREEGGMEEAEEVEGREEGGREEAEEVEGREGEEEEAEEEECFVDIFFFIFFLFFFYFFF